MRLGTTKGYRQRGGPAGFMMLNKLGTFLSWDTYSSFTLLSLRVTMMGKYHILNYVGENSSLSKGVDSIYVSVG